MEIQVQYRTVYGEERLYPMCENAKRFAQIAGTQTLTYNTVRLVRQLGVSIVELDRRGRVIGELEAA